MITAHYVIVMIVAVMFLASSYGCIKCHNNSAFITKWRKVHTKIKGTDKEFIRKLYFMEIRNTIILGLTLLVFVEIFRAIF